MQLKNLKIKNFRNYDDLKLELSDGINIIYGDNGQGKTNLLESIYVLSFTKSHRSFIDNTLIKNEKNNAIIKGTLVNGLSYDLEIIIEKNKKQIKMDGNVINKIGDYIEKMNIITFYSDDLDLIKGSPQERRKYLNLGLSQISKNYYNTVNDYNKLIKTRNDYLKKLSNKEKINQEYFDILTEYIVEKSVFIYQMRDKYINKLNNSCGTIYENITGKKGFHVKYVPSIELKDTSKETIRALMKEKLTEMVEKEIGVRSTLYGPHRDDFEFYLNKNNLKNYGSQGQQRAAILALKLSEIEIFKGHKKTNPIILLDDVFSELDKDVRNNLLDYIKNDMQVIITTTDLTHMDKKIINKAKLINIKQGKIIEEVKQ